MSLYFSGASGPVGAAGCCWRALRRALLGANGAGCRQNKCTANQNGARESVSNHERSSRSVGISEIIRLFPWNAAALPPEGVQPKDHIPRPTAMLDDIRTSVRSLRSTPTLTIVALLVLTLGIGASTAIFSVVDAVVLRGLPFDEHDRLVAVGERRAPRPDSPMLATPNPDPAAVSSSAPQNYMDWAKQQTVFESIAAIAGRCVHAQGAGPRAGGNPGATGHRGVLQGAARAARAWTGLHRGERS